MLLLVVFITLLLPAVAAAEERLSVFVSILPQKYFVERVGGERVTVGVMVGPGESPHTYDPTPRQLANLSVADLYFRIGVGFEHVWMDKLAAINPKMTVVDTRRQVPLRAIEGHSHHHGESSGHHHGEGEADPHIWLSPPLVKRQATTIYEALSQIDPAGADYYRANLEGFCQDLDALDQWIRHTLGDLKTRSFMVFHPSWGYYADAYDLVQIPIEIGGSEPSARQLAELIGVARKKRVKAIFVQSQINAKSAAAVARAVGAKVVQLDPLAEDYLENLRQITLSLYQALAE
ncbi:MAG: zinc ABC transporter solute-binding protein [Firmicutes bacterium]|nr:zinc ABC transporter solute-binding protein [Bacillota bacterium]